MDRVHAMDSWRTSGAGIGTEHEHTPWALTKPGIGSDRGKVRANYLPFGAIVGEKYDVVVLERDDRNRSTGIEFLHRRCACVLAFESSREIAMVIDETGVDLRSLVSRIVHSR
jgi:hypothetical protein